MTRLIYQHTRMESKTLHTIFHMEEMEFCRLTQLSVVVKKEYGLSTGELPQMLAQEQCSKVTGQPSMISFTGP